MVNESINGTFLSLGASSASKPALSLKTQKSQRVSRNSVRSAVQYTESFDRRFASASTVGYCVLHIQTFETLCTCARAVRTGYPTEAPRHVTKSTPAPMGAGGSILKRREFARSFLAFTRCLHF